MKAINVNYYESLAEYTMMKIADCDKELAGCGPVHRQFAFEVRNIQSLIDDYSLPAAERKQFRWELMGVKAALREYQSKLEQRKRALEREFEELTPILKRIQEGRERAAMRDPSALCAMMELG